MADLYVDNTSSACTDSGSGTAAAPFCTIQAAADVVTPGQTVLIGGMNTDYGQDVVVKTSGTASAPITFKAQRHAFTVFEPDHAFTLTGVSNIIIDGLYADSTGDAVLVSGSSNITIQNSTLRQDTSSPTSTIAGVHVTGASHAVTVQRDWFQSFSQDGVGVRVDGGSTGTVVATNMLGAPGINGIQVVGASGTEIVGNNVGDLYGGVCGAAISVTSASTSTSVENNVLLGVSTDQSCQAGSALVDLQVSADSAAGTIAQYNVLSTGSGGTTPYSWAGVKYTAATAFQNATGKGTEDFTPATVDLSTNAIPTASPAIDSADANALGETSTDIYGNPRVDDPSIADTGIGSATYADRGAIEYQEYTSSTLTAAPMFAQTVETNLSLQGVPWGYDTTETINWGDGTNATNLSSGIDVSTDFTRSFGGRHTYASRGTYTITDTLTDNARSKTLTTTFTTTGTTYTPVAPTRVLDTRTGTGTGGKRTAVPAKSAVAFDVTSGVTGAPAAADIKAVVLNVTVTAPKVGGYLTAYPDATTRPASSNLNFSANETVPNLVTVETGANGKVDLYNGSGGSTHVVADVQGYYVDSAAGSGYVPAGPTRLLDTRKGTGTGGKPTVIPANGTLNLKIEGNGAIPGSGVTAVALNVTVTAPKTGGYLTAYPGKTARPTSSNLNFSPNETVPNMVIVPVGSDGTVNFTNTSGGTAALVADLFGYYTA
ncbi:MAG: right-handed parallel beta-helix repeat-containing protein, partial [Actinocrinis sp.]